MSLIKDILSLWQGVTWGTFRLHDGRMVFDPWGVQRVVYLLPSDQTYRKIRRSVLLWGLLFVFGGVLVGPAALHIFLLSSKEFTWSVFALEVVACLSPMIFMYIRWASKVTRGLPFLDGQTVNQGLDPTTAKTYEDGVRRNLASFSLFTLWILWMSSTAGTAGSIYMLIEKPHDWRLWLCFLVLGAMSAGMLLAIRIKRQTDRSAPP